MMSDRYRRDVGQGLLCYLNKDGMVGVTPSNMYRRKTLKTCIQHNATCEGGDGVSTGYPEGLFDTLTGHLTDAHKTFIARWVNLIDLESRSISGKQKETWSMDAYKRERARRCISHLQLTVDSQLKKQIDNMVALRSFSVGECFTYTFTRHASHPELQ
ncbi:hypothetical protein SARC_05603, partial [Sphaeroforma arctica JP610]